MKTITRKMIQTRKMILMFWVANPNLSDYKYKTTFIYTITTIQRNRPELVEEWFLIGEYDKRICYI